MWVLAWKSRDRTNQLLAYVLIASWAASNLVYMGFKADKNLIIPQAYAVLDLMMLGATAASVWKRHTRRGWAILLVFIAMMVTHAAGVKLQLTTKFFYFALLNGLYILQLVIVGGDSGLRILAHRRVLGPSHRHHSMARQ